MDKWHVLVCSTKHTKKMLCSAKHKSGQRSCSPADQVLTQEAESSEIYSAVRAKVKAFDHLMVPKIRAVRSDPVSPLQRRKCCNGYHRGSILLALTATVVFKGFMTHRKIFLLTITYIAKVVWKFCVCTNNIYQQGHCSLFICFELQRKFMLGSTHETCLKAERQEESFGKALFKICTNI